MRKWIVSFGGLGLLPLMPGTYGAFAAAVIFYFACIVLRHNAFVAALAASAVISVVAVLLAPWAERHFQSPDPRPFVLDEVVGQWLTVLLVPILAADKNPLTFVATGFFLFRAFDIAKPFPIREVERLPHGLGILLDDVMAGLYACGVLWALTWLVHILHPVKA